MKFRHLLPLLALCSPLAALAVPAYPGLIKQTNPDGSQVEIRLHGDEYFSYTTDAQGQWLMEQNAEGYWQVAVRGGQRLAATAENIQTLQQIDEANFAKAAVEPMGKYAELGTDGRSKFPCTGSGTYLIVLLEYSDTKFSMEDPQAYYTNWFNQEDFQDGDIQVSAFSYYKKVSDGHFTPNFIISPVVTLPATSAYYVGGNKYALFKTGAMWALRKLAQDGFDFSRFDLDNDNVIDNVYFIFAGYGQADTGDVNTIWPHASSLTGTYGGLSGGRYACSNELRGSHYYKKDGTKTGIGTFCHEFGHVLGLPDLYDPNYDSACEAVIPGNWSIMSNGSYLGDGCRPAGYAAYDRWACRWMEYTEITNEQQCSLQPLTTEAKAYRLSIPTSNNATEYYIFENRTKEDMDLNVPHSGMLIWHVDYDQYVWRANRVNSTASRPRCTIMPPSGMTVSNGQWPSVGAYGTMVAPGLSNSFKSYNGVSGTWTPAVSHIAYDNETHVASFNYTPNPETFDATPSVSLGIETDVLGFHAYWPEVEGATGYIVNVQRRNTAGTLYSVDNYIDKMVTDTDVKINESAAMMKQEHQVRVRVMGASLPSTNEFVSEWIKPIDMPEYSAVSTIGIDEPLNVYTENGNIIAPEGAKAYSLSGVETGLQNLPAGIYIVRVANRAVKVIVR